MNSLPENIIIDPIRASLLRLPRFLQPFLTWLTAYALPGQKRLFRISPAAHLVLSAGTILVAVSLNLLLVRSLLHLLS